MARIRQIKNLVPSMYPKYRIKVGARGDWITTRGGKKMQKMLQWGYFKIVTNDKDRKTGNFVPADDINQILGKEPKELNVALSFDNPLLSIFSRYLCWKKDAEDPCFCEGDGQRASRWIGKDKREWIDCNDIEPCPYFARKECRLDARIVVRLLDITDRPVKALFKTTSANALGDWLECCYDVALASGGILKDIPLKLVIKPYQQVFPDSKSGGVKMGPISYIVGLEQAENNEKVLQLANEYRKMRALSGIDQKLLESGQMEFQARLLTAIPEEDGDELEYYENDDNGGMPVLPNEDDDPIESVVTGETFSGPGELFEKLKWLAPQHPAYWEQKTGRMLNAAHVNGELGKLKNDNKKLMDLYNELNAWIQENDEAKAKQETAGLNGEHELIVTSTERVEEMIKRISELPNKPAVDKWKAKHYLEINNAKPAERKRILSAINRASGNGQERMDL